ncbi:hypothetical protein E3N88_26551 [Mikania micrantha]|uniref:Uncharacterized protein n=1 Tax=Mikania micrantha TaxID=192012 RepID=A0A5N6MV93_9ASTR|nr:hypothetical protein E3N88_26551 [Mikania micrantha]
MNGSEAQMNDLLLPFPHAATPLPATPYPPPPSASLPMEAVPIPATLTPAVSDCSSSGNSLRWLLFLLCVMATWVLHLGMSYLTKPHSLCLQVPYLDRQSA